MRKLLTVVIADQIYAYLDQKLRSCNQKIRKVPGKVLEKQMIHFISTGQ